MRTKLLSSIARLVVRCPKRVIGASFCLTAISIILAATSLQMNTDQDDLVSERIEYHKRYKDYLREFGDLEYLYVVVETGDNPKEAKDFIRALSKRLEVIPDIKEVTYQISNPKLEKGFLLYLPKDQIRAIGEYLPKMEDINSSADVFAMMNGEIDVAAELALPKSGKASFAATLGKASSAATSLETGFRLLDNLLDGLIDAAKDNRPYTPFLQQAFFGGDRAYDEDGFLLSENGRLLFVMIMPEKNYKTLAVIDEPLKKIRAALDDTRREFPNIKAGLTGRPVLAADEMSISDTDMRYAAIAAIFIVTLLFILYFKRPTRPAMAAVSLVCGIAQTFGLATVVIGHLNILSIVFAVILVGAGIEFGLQIVSRYREELNQHKNAGLAVETCITQTGKGNMTACATTAAAFFAACFTNFLALQELGVIAGFGILLCLANMFTVLPAMMYLRDKGKPKERLHTTLRIDLHRFGRFYKRPKLVVAITAVITLSASFGLFRVKFNHNLLDLQAGGLESVRYEKKILEESSQSTWYVPFMVSSYDDIQPLVKRLKELPSVGRIETVSEAVPEEQEEKIKIINVIASPRQNAGGQAKGVAISRNRTRGIASRREGTAGRALTPAMTQELEKFRKNIARLTEMAFSAGEAEAVEALESTAKKTDELIQLLTGHDARIANFDKSFTADLKHHMELLKSGLNPEPISIEDMPEAIQKRYISPSTKRIAVYAYPKEDIWNPYKMEKFIKDIRSIDPAVTGVPVEVYESSRLLEKSFAQAAVIAMLAIIFIVAIDFKNLRLTLLALTPLTLGILWLLELMGIFGIRFNLANFFGIPILLGIGIDNAVQIVHRYIKDRHIESVSSFMTRSTGTAVLLTSLTTIASFGTLIFARHKGIASLGVIMSLGTATCFIGSMIVLPCALKIFGPKE